MTLAVAVFLVGLSPIALGFSLPPSHFSPLTSPFPAQDRPTFRTRAELVVLHVSVRDRGGRYVTGLTKDAFTVIDDGKPQALEMFSSDEVPASIGLLIDNSNSMRPNRERVIASSVALTQTLHPQDEVFVLTFNDAVQHVWEPSVVSATAPEVLRRRMADAIVARGMTAIYDGVMAGISKLAHARHTRQVLIVVSDGDDNASRTKRDEVIAGVRESDATVYTVALEDPILRDGNPGLLRQLARETGGEFFNPRRVDDVPDAFERIAKDIRNGYTLAYQPTRGDSRPGRRRSVNVYVRAPDGRAVRVRTRDGYFEGQPEVRQ